MEPTNQVNNCLLHPPYLATVTVTQTTGQQSMAPPALAHCATKVSPKLAVLFDGWHFWRCNMCTKRCFFATSRDVGIEHVLAKIELELNDDQKEKSTKFEKKQVQSIKLLICLGMKKIWYHFQNERSKSSATLTYHHSSSAIHADKFRTRHGSSGHLQGRVWFDGQSCMASMIPRNLQQDLHFMDP